MRINSQLCLTISWLGVLVSAESSFHRSSEKLEHRSIGEQESGRDDKTGEESRQRRFSFETDAFEPLVPPDFQHELSKLKIPVAEDLPRRIEMSREEESREENEHGTDEENGSEQYRTSQEDSPESEREGNQDDDENSKEEEDDERSNEESNEEDGDRREEEPTDYEDYDSPKNTISYHYDDSGDKPKKPKKKRPYVNYEVTETIPYDTKTVRPKQTVYPLPPPCPGAPPPTYPTTEAPSTKMPPPPKPPVFPPAPTFPPFPKIFPDSPSSLLSQDDFLDSYFPTSFMSSSSSSFPKPTFRMPAPARKRPLKRYTTGGKESQIHKRVANPRVILRYHQPTALVIRKVQHGPPPDRLIIRKPLSPPVKEVHIHHHHDTPGQVLHIHKDDDGTVLDTARFKAKVEGQRLKSDSQYETATTGPFAEPPSNIRLSSRRVS